MRHADGFGKKMKKKGISLTLRTLVTFHNLLRYRRNATLCCSCQYLHFLLQMITVAASSSIVLEVWIILHIKGELCISVHFCYLTLYCDWSVSFPSKWILKNNILKYLLTVAFSLCRKTRRMRRRKRKKKRRKKKTCHQGKPLRCLALLLLQWVRK